MKFAQYLQDTQTPEWKRAYIDYRGLKKHISVIKKSQKRRSVDSTTWENFSTAFDSRRSSLLEAPLEAQISNGDAPSSASIEGTIPEDAASVQQSTRQLLRPSRFSLSSVRKASFRARMPSFTGRFFGGKQSEASDENARRSFLEGLPLPELLAILPPQEAAFFTLLDAELQKVDAFNMAREGEMLARGHLLQLQFKELRDHKKLVLARAPAPWTETLRSTILSTMMSSAGSGSKSADNESGPDPSDSTLVTMASSSAMGPFAPTTSVAKPNGLENDHTPTKGLDSSETPGSPQLSHSFQDSRASSADPESYILAKRKLKKAVLEHYKGLEVLNNYRILNVTGFRKALKKFEKVTKIPVQTKYMTEKVERSSLAFDKAVKAMTEQMEDLYATAFSHGNRKKAMKHLRASTVSQSHHFSMYRSGMYLGLALPPLVDGLLKVFQQPTRDAIPAWNILLYLYGIILVPVLFSNLVGLNLMVWAQTRINYVFIFELKVSNCINYHEYLELPSILLTTLCYCFWFSFSLVGSPRINPTTWPLVWFCFTLVFLFNPMPMAHKATRFWFIKQLGIQLAAGMKPVEFTDFWLGDQLCSLIFTLSNLYTFVCVYVEDFPLDLGRCGVVGPRWAAVFALAALPLAIRFAQSIRRYLDSGLGTHLINAGKYGSGIIMNLLYCYWRHHGERKILFIFWCLSAAWYSIYACTWDFLMDWSLLQVHETKYPLLRQNLLYSNSVYVYYFALVSNLLLRFLWVVYIPAKGPSMMLRSFIVAILEMLRRVQWNFFRLENEHLGNMDQYRVTREVPLPYAIDETRRHEEDDDEDVRLKRQL